jgi:hypothetical protein
MSGPVWLGLMAQFDVEWVASFVEYASIGATSVGSVQFAYQPTTMHTGLSCLYKYQLEMIDLLKSISLFSGALVIAIVSGVCAIAWARISLSQLKWGLAIGAPALFAYSLYWSPVWLGADSSEYWNFAPIIIGTWFTAGVIPSALVVHFLSKSVGPQTCGSACLTLAAADAVPAPLSIGVRSHTTTERYL